MRLCEWYFHCHPLPPQRKPLFPQPSHISTDLDHVPDLLVVCTSNTFLTVPITQGGKNQKEGENMYQVMTFSNAITWIQEPIISKDHAIHRCGAVQNMQRPNPFLHQSFALLCVIPYQSSDIITCVPPPPFLHPASTPAQHQHHQPPPPKRLPQNP